MPPRPPRKLNSPGLFEYAVRVLGGRAHSTGEMREKLARRAERAADVDEIVARLKSAGYLDDQRFAENFASARKANEGFGKIRVVRDLRRKRIAPAAAERAASRVYADSREEELIDAFIRRKYRGGAPQDPKDIASAYRRLLHAGFSSANSIRALKKFARDPELLDSFEPPPEGYDGE